MENNNELNEKKFRREINPLAMQELREEVFASFPKVITALEKALKEKNEILVDYVQINGDHLHYPILVKGPTYWYGIWTQDKQGNITNLTRICDYIGIGNMIRNLKVENILKE